MRSKFDRVPAALIAGTIVMATGLSDPASAKSARCYTSDDGHYNCSFTGTDNRGSFRISAPGKPTYLLNVDKPGVAYGYADFGTGRNVALPGYYMRQRQDPACWSNSETNTSICAW